MESSLIVVDGCIATKDDDTNLRDDAWSLALDQRAFGPRRLLVAFAEADGRLRSIAHAPRTDPPELALSPCIQHCGIGAAAAIAYCDEPVSFGPPPPDLADRFGHARSVAAALGIHLVDWIACDDHVFRSSRMALHPDEPWWTVPPPSEAAAPFGPAPAGRLPLMPRGPGRVGTRRGRASDGAARPGKSRQR